MAISFTAFLIVGLVLVWWLSYSLTRAVLVRPEKLTCMEKLPEKESCSHEQSSQIVVVCSSFEGRRRGPFQPLCELREARFGERVFGGEGVGEGGGRWYIVGWNCDLESAKSLGKDKSMKKIVNTLEKKISGNSLILIVADTVPTFHLSRAIDKVARDSTDTSMLRRLAAILSKFDAYIFDGASGEPVSESLGEGDKEDNRGGNGGDSNEASKPRQSLQLSTVAEEARFGRQWLVSTWEERVQLYVLARGGFANQNRAAVLSSLLNRGLVKIEGSESRRGGKRITLRSAEFGDYIRNSLSHDELKAWQRAGHSNRWRKIWPPLTTIAVLALLFFLNANPEALAVLVALLGASVGAAPIAISLARGWRSPASSDS